jgi:hypothetical protein
LRSQVAEDFLAQMSSALHQQACEQSRRQLAVTAQEIFGTL